MKKKPSFIGAIGYIPAALKGFPKNLFSKPKTLDEYEQYQQAGNAFIWLSFIPFILFCVLTALQVDEGVNMIVGMIGFAALIYLAYRKNQLKNFYGDKLEALACPECRAPIQYDENVQYKLLDLSWSVSSRKRQMGSQNNPNQYVSASGSLLANVTLTCKCQQCGTEKKINESFTVGHCSKSMDNVNPMNADMVRAQLENDVRAVCKTVFDERKTPSNYKGVSVKAYDLDTSIKEYFAD